MVHHSDHSNLVEKFLAFPGPMMFMHGDLGNHSIRAAVTAMQEVYRRILADDDIQDADRDIVPVAESFRLQDMDQVKDIEGRYLR